MSHRNLDSVWINKQEDCFRYEQSMDIKPGRIIRQAGVRGKEDAGKDQWTEVARPGQATESE